jgi:hypothetical protein
MAVVHMEMLLPFSASYAGLPKPHTESANSLEVGCRQKTCFVAGCGGACRQWLPNMQLVSPSRMPATP